jgi:hypothetical protein
VFHCEREADVEERSPVLIELKLRMRFGVGGLEDEMYSISNRKRTILEMWFPLLSEIQQSDARSSPPP